MLIEVVILLAGCLVLGFIFSRLKQSPLVGYLFAGMLLGGPGSIKAISSTEHIEAIAELGVSLLLFSLGLEFSWEHLKRLGKKALLNGVLQIMVTALVGALLTWTLGLKLVEAIAIGAMVSLSSTAAVLRILSERSEIDTLHGRNSLAILLVQDMAVVPLAILITLLSGKGTFGEIALNLAKLALLIAAFIFILWLIVKISVKRILANLVIHQNRELITLFAVVISLGAAWGAHAIGLSSALGAFIVGMFLGSSIFAPQIRSEISSLRVVLLTLFFGAVGMVADPVWILKNWWMVLYATTLVVLVKSLIIWIILKLTKNPTGVSVATGLCLAQIGEFSFVLGLAARNGGVIGEQLYMLMISTAILSLILTPYLISAAPRIALYLESLRSKKRIPDSKSSTSHDFTPDVVIIGFGPAGQHLGNQLCCTILKTLVIDLNPSIIKLAESLGLRAKLGDATNLEFLQHLKVDKARLIAITLPSHTSALQILQQLRLLALYAQIIVRSRYQRFSEDIKDAGADFVIGDEEEIGGKLSEKVMELIGEAKTLSVQPFQE